MIEIVKGNLLHAQENIIGHQVNCQGKMASGVAKQVRAKYPHVFTEYCREINRHMAEGDIRENLLGKVQGVYVGNDKMVANIFGQLNYGYDGNVYTDINALYKGFKTLRDVAERVGYSVALPYGIGCYRGGADWNEVEILLLTAFDGYKVKLYKYHEGR